MTFVEFSSIVKTYRPEVQVTKHQKVNGQCTGQKRIVVTIVFSNGKTYDYTGSYQDILKKLGINVLASSTKQKMLAEYKATLQGKQNILNNINKSPFKNWAGYVDNLQKSIAELEKSIAELEKK